MAPQVTVIQRFMTLTTLVGPSAVLISKEALLTAGSYSRTPPNGAAYLVAKLRGAGGAIYCRAGNHGGAGSGAYIQGMIPVAPNDAFALTVGAAGIIIADGSANEEGGELSQVSKNGNTLLLAGGGAGAGGLQGYTDSTRLSACGGYGYYPGTRDTASAGGGSSYIDPSVTRTALSADGSYAGIATVPGQPGKPGYLSSPDFAITVGQGAYLS